MKTNYILIDYENVQPAMIAALEQDHFRILVFVGANQSKIVLDVAMALQRMGSRAEYIKIAGHGTNALDFHIAFYIGKLSAADAEAYFHIISKDTGFDPLIQHLKEQKLRVNRYHDLSEIPIVRAAAPAARPPALPTPAPLALPAPAPVPPALAPARQAPTLSERAAQVVSDLKKRGAAKPRSVKTLSGTINALFQKQLSEPEIAALLRELQQCKIITVEGIKISYPGPGTLKA